MLLDVFLHPLESSGGATIGVEDHRLYRLAGLLHDIGHFPFSHAFEDAVSDYYKNSKTTPPLLSSDVPGDGGDDGLSSTQDDPLDHESVGQILLDNDSEISSILKGHDVAPSDIYSIFAREGPQKFANLISSDLDADRIDYLLRTARYTGLPYGSVDLEYILTQMRLDEEGRICLTPKALRTAEHFLLSRYFDYQQVSYHKTVAGFEEVLKDIVVGLLEMDAINCSTAGIRKMIASGSWYEFDDLQIFETIRKLRQDSENLDEALKVKVQSLLTRVPPKLIGSIEFIGDRNERGTHERNVRLLRRVSRELSNTLSIDASLWYVWDSKGRALTRIGPYIPVSVLPPNEDDLDQSIRIKESSGSRPIVEIDNSLMKVLSQQALYTARLYVLFPNGRASERQMITEQARDMVDDELWVDGK